MTPEEIRKLLGGYATGTLTEAEQQALFAAALEDQDLFDELAREQPLHELLRDPAARAEMLAAVTDQPKAWVWWRPAAAALAMAGIATFALLLPRKKAPEAPPTIVAEVKPAPPTPEVIAPPSAPAVATQVARKRETAAKPLKTFQPPPAPPVPAPVPAPETPTIAEAPKAPAPKGVVGGMPGGVLGGIYPPPPASVTIPAPPARNSFTPSTESVVVMAEAAPVPQRPSARTLFFGARPTRLRVQTAAVADAAATRDLGLRYSILRKEGALFVPADPEAITKADELALRFTANVNGFLSLAGGEPVALTAMQPYTTPLLDPKAGEIRVVFARTAQTSLAAPSALATEVSAGEVYVVNTVPGMPVGFTITLKRK